MASEKIAGEVSALGERGFFVRENFAGAAAALAARALIEQLPLVPAGVGRGREVASAVRGDAIAWTDAPELRAPFEALRIELNEAAWLGLQRFDLQVARYVSGGAYERHSDAFRGGPSRRVTAIWYLNENWAPSQGGRLRLHLDGEILDVEPMLDRLVVFMSERVEHEVLAAAAMRWALTAWYYGA